MSALAKKPKYANIEIKDQKLAYAKSKRLSVDSKNKRSKTKQD